MSVPHWLLASRDSGGDEPAGAIRQAAIRRLAGQHPVADAELLDRLRQSDDAALARLFERYEEAVRGVGYAITRSLSDADDVVQRVFIGVWRHRMALQVTGEVRAYLTRAAYNESLNLLRGARRAARTSDAWGVAHEGTHASDTSRGTDVTLDIAAAVATLPERTRHIFSLLWYEQRSYEEVAHMLGITVKGVERARARAIVHLARELGAYRREAP